MQNRDESVPGLTETDEADREHQDELLSFHIADEEYAVDILRVREIRGWGNVTRIPRVPDYVRGVLNMRGAVVPVIDLRLRFGLEAQEYGPATVLVVLRTGSGEDKRDVGVVVDAVSDVYSVAPKDVKPAPDFGGGGDSNFIKGLTTQDESMVIILDVDRLLDTRDLNRVESRAAEAGVDGRTDTGDADGADASIARTA